VEMKKPPASTDGGAPRGLMRAEESTHLGGGGMIGSVRFARTEVAIGTPQFEKGHSRKGGKTRVGSRWMVVGRHKTSFFQKRCPSRASGGLKTVSFWGKKKNKKLVDA